MIISSSCIFLFPFQGKQNKEGGWMLIEGRTKERVTDGKKEPICYKIWIFIFIKWHICVNVTYQGFIWIVFSFDVILYSSNTVRNWTKWQKNISLIRSLWAKCDFLSFKRDVDVSPLRLEFRTTSCRFGNMTLTIVVFFWSKQCCACNLHSILS